MRVELRYKNHQSPAKAAAAKAASRKFMADMKRAAAPLTVLSDMWHSAYMAAGQPAEFPVAKDMWPDEWAQAHEAYTKTLAGIIAKA